MKIKDLPGQRVRAGDSVVRGGEEMSRANLCAREAREQEGSFVSGKVKKYIQGSVVNRALILLSTKSQHTIKPTSMNRCSSAHLLLLPFRGSMSAHEVDFLISASITALGNLLSPPPPFLPPSSSSILRAEQTADAVGKASPLGA